MGDLSLCQSGVDPSLLQCTLALPGVGDLGKDPAKGAARDRRLPRNEAWRGLHDAVPASAPFHPGHAQPETEVMRLRLQNSQIP